MRPGNQMMGLFPFDDMVLFWISLFSRKWPIFSDGNTLKEDCGKNFSFFKGSTSSFLNEFIP